MGTTVVNGKSCTNKGTATIDVPNPDTPKIK
jgi:hypothetical protein